MNNSQLTSQSRNERYIHKVKSHDIQQNVKIYTEIIYHNFIELAQHTYVKHTREDIYRLLTSDQMFGYIVIYSNKIIAYLFGEISLMPDGRNAYYLSYIYVSPKYQHLHLGTELLSLLINHCKHFGIPFIVLTCDTEDVKVMNFYAKFGFISDPVLKNNRRHDVLCLYL